MNKKLSLLFIPATIIILYSMVMALDPETQKIMPFVSTTRDCLKCHSPDDANNFRNPSQACDPMCMMCHKSMGSHHAVGIKLEGDLPAGLGPLTERGKLMCITCHDLRHPRYDSNPWRSESLYESIFQKQRNYKTYYLTVKNSKGQLCNKCH